MSVTRTAIIGTGAIADAHATAVAESGGRAVLVAAVDLDAAKVREFADRWGIEATYSDLAEMLRTERPDLLHICTPPQSHVPLARIALEAGVHVLIEKPPALTLAEASELIELDAASTASAMIVFQHRFGSGATRVRDMLAAGDLGSPLVALCETLWFRADSYYDLPWRGTWQVEGGGPTLGHGIHQFDMLLSILGPWSEVTAMASRLERPTDTEDVSAAVVRFESGAIATIVNSLLSPRETSIVRFDFTRATAEVEHLYGYGDDDWSITPAPGADDVAARWAALAGGVPSGHTAQLTAILDAIEHGTTPPVSPSEAFVTMELVAAIYRSAFTGEVVRRGDIDAASPFWSRMDGAGAPWAAVTA